MSLEDRTNVIREKLLKELENSPPNFDRILKLSSEMSHLDPDFVRFSVDASHISRIGRELVGRAETAVAELVKNAYDADASKVTLTFKDADLSGGTLIIYDNGVGMTRDEIVNGFMRISTTDKVHNPRSPIYRRPRAGRKGIGRFSAQRLGNELILITQNQADDFALKVSIDWKLFDQDKDLSVIKNRIEKIEKKATSGTKLIISGLNDSWTDAQIRRVYRYSLNLVQPFPISKKQKVKSDPGFKSIFIRKQGDDEEVIADDHKMVFDHALAVVEGAVDENGQGQWKLLSKKLELKENNEFQASEDCPKFKSLRNIKFKVYYFIFNQPDLLPSQTNSNISSLAKENGGVRIYRNGFRVRPYGERSNDWLNLDQSSRGREILPPHANINFFGFVEIIDPEGQQFEETASREGLIENDSYEELQSFVFTVLRSAVLRIAATRGTKQTAGQKNWKKKTPASSEEKAKNAVEKLKSIAGSSAKGKGQQSSEFEEVARDSAEALHELLDMIDMLRVLASLGLTIGEFTHEMKHYLPTIFLDLDEINDKIDDVEALEVFHRVENNLKTISAYSGYFDSAISENVTRERRPQDLRDAINSFSGAVSSLLKRTGIEITTEINGYDLYTTPMHESEWASILQNLFSNSKKAINKVKTNGEIVIRAGREGGSVFLEFVDNGVGIADENKDKVFDAFFTTSQPGSITSDEHDEMIGSGLGLKLVYDIVAAVGGEIYIATPPNGYSTCIRIDVPEAKEEEIPVDD